MPFRQHMLTVAAIAAIVPGVAQGQSESRNWGFNDAASRANAAIVQDMIRKQQSGFYTPPTYVTNIERQYNCSVSATATGNAGSNTAVANSPSTSGAVSSATGNNASTNVDGYGYATLPAGVSGEQDNSGRVSAGVDGGTSTTVRNSDSWQALNSTETNSGAQTASVGASNACAFATAN